MSGNATYGFVLFFNLLSAINAKKAMDGAKIGGNKIRVRLYMYTVLYYLTQVFLFFSFVPKCILLFAIFMIANRLDMVKAHLVKYYGLMVLITPSPRSEWSHSFLSMVLLYVLE